MHPALEGFRDRSRALSTLSYLAGQMLLRTGLRNHRSGANSVKYNTAENVEYATRVFEDYLHYGNLSTFDLVGKRVLEIGPGDNLAVAVLFIASGASSCVCLDRFQSDVDEGANRAIYRALAASLNPERRALLVGHLDAEGYLVSNRIERTAGVGIEDAPDRLPAHGFDLIVSRAVMEHVAHLERAWRSMDLLLTDGGRMLHKIDLRAHGFYEHIHPLEFLTIARPLWNRLSAPDPTLNRGRLSTHIELAARFGYDVTMLITHLATRTAELIPHRGSLVKGVDYDEEDLQQIERIRERLVEPFRDMSVQELLVSGIFLNARKALHPPSPPAQGEVEQP